MRKSLTAAVAAAAIATATVVSVAGVASASASAPRKATTLSIVEARTTITAGQVDSIGGVLKSHRTPLAHRIVILDRFWAKRWRPVEEKLTGKFGGVSFLVKPQVSTGYKLVFPGGTVYAPTHSGTVVVRVKKPVVKTPTALWIWQSAPAITAGQTDTIKGGLSADSQALPKRWVWLAVATNGKAHLLRAHLTDKAGDITFTVGPKTTTSYELVYLGSKDLDGVVSGTVTTTVTPPPAAA